MLPSVVAKEVHENVALFLKESFRTTTPAFFSDGETLIERFVRTPGNLFKGPWVDIKLPFRAAEPGAELPFRHIRLPYAPYAHQVQAFHRLSLASGGTPRSTIVATGTGSGKTECFMYPLLDYCLSERKPGIKAVIIYPMNALATDQARRFAKEVHALKSDLRVGLFTGDRAEDRRHMSADSVITNHDELRDNPPDILLTNYKMLDFLLMRPKDQPLWRHNTPGVLRYVIVDELHTFDGAQGTDLACLLRRLRDRLDAREELLCVGTSATIGSSAEAKGQLREYARTVFFTEFDEDSIIGETRLSLEEYLERFAADPHPDVGTRLFGHWPTEQLYALEPYGQTQEEFMERVADAWFSESAGEGAEPPRFHFTSSAASVVEASRVRLAYALRAHSAFRQLMARCGQVTNVQELAERWAEVHSAEDVPLSTDDALLLLDSLVALISYARDRRPTGDGLEPMLHVRAHLWLRELRRMVAGVTQGPVDLVHDNDIRSLRERVYLPVTHCRECLSMAWVGTLPNYEGALNSEPNDIYRDWFAKSGDIKLFIPLDGTDIDPTTRSGQVRYLCADCGDVSSRESHTCRIDGSASERVRVWPTDHVNHVGDEVRKRQIVCPICSARDSLTIVGSRAASIASAGISKLFGSNYADDRKLIAFSDSVQDAAHRAGFFGSRTYMNVLRLAFQKTLQALPDGSNLEEFLDAVVTGWRQELGDEDYVGTFIAPNQEWRSEYEALRVDGKLPRGGSIVELVSKRLRWESLMEFSLRSNVGRSLEKTGAVALGVDEELIREVAKTVFNEGLEHLAMFERVSRNTVAAFIRGLLTRWRQRGAWDVAEIRGLCGGSSNNVFGWSRRTFDYLPYYGRVAFPAPLLAGPGRNELLRNAEQVLRLSPTSTRWLADWYRRTLLRDAVLDTTSLDEVMTLVLKALQSNGVLVKQSYSDPDAYLMPLTTWRLHQDAWEVSCDRCRHRLTVPEVDVDRWGETPCMRPLCQGHYSERQQLPNLRERNVPEPVRLVPAEHTGLLEGPERKRIEESFIHREHPWDVNVLSATPTLEMGINIGDLSSVLLCSVPPAQANYLQRIGRAGRRDGNALALVVANGEEHDNYFYADPLQMIAGEVATPGVFLQAMAVLERQLIAYGFDRWVCEKRVRADAIPPTLKSVIASIGREDSSAFPHPYLDFVEENAGALLDRFCALFPEIDDEGRQHLHGFIHGGKSVGALGWRIINRLERLRENRDSLRKRVEECGKALNVLKTQPEDPKRNEAMEQLESEQASLKALIRSIEARNTLNFFTDEGLLPNYAFPEEGVTLDSVIVRQSAPQRGAASSDEKKRNYTTMSFQRSASSALGELVPDSTFFASEHKLTIEQVDLALSKPEEWRLCDRCHYTENLAESADKAMVCPRCGSATWPDISRKKTLVRLRQVYAHADARNDRIDDSSDNRAPAFYTRQLLVDVPPDAPRRAVRIKSDELPFGFEYLTSVGFREINFGSATAGGSAFRVAGDEKPKVGFKICRHCGFVQRPQNVRKHRPTHSRTCETVQSRRDPTDQDWIESLYLYRELRSETLRILLPIAEVEGSRVAKVSFTAALQMGLQRHFRGNVHHLGLTEVDDPTAEEGGRRHFIYVYDRVPGGTGYLKDLMRRPENLFELVETALKTLLSCSCAESAELDGCYKCILAHRTARQRRNISRRRAIEILELILANRHNTEEIASLDEVPLASGLESQIEQQLVHALSSQFELVTRRIHGKAAYSIHAGDYVWELEPQFDVVDSTSKRVVTRPDQALRLVSAPHGVDKARYTSAIFMDGWQYHRQSVRGDISKRRYLLGRGYRVWTLTSNDLPREGALRDRSTPENLSLISDPAGEGESSVFKFPPIHAWKEAAADLNVTWRQGSFQWLCDFIRNPIETEEKLRDAAFYQVLTRVKMVKSPDWSSFTPYVGAELNDELTGGPWLLLGGQASSEGVPAARLLTAVIAKGFGHGEGIGNALTAALWLDDERLQEDSALRGPWESFWVAANLLQFAPRFAFASKSEIASYQATDGWEHWPERLPPTAPYAPQDNDVDEGWADVLDPSYGAQLPREELQLLINVGLPAPEVGADIVQGNATVATAELLWSEHKVALLLDEEPPPIEGWFFVSANQPEWVKLVIERITGEGG